MKKHTSEGKKEHRVRNKFVMTEPNKQVEEYERKEEEKKTSRLYSEKESSF